MALDFGTSLGIALILSVEQSACIGEASSFPHEKAQALVACLVGEQEESLSSGTQHRKYILGHWEGAPY